MCPQDNEPNKIDLTVDRFRLLSTSVLLQLNIGVCVGCTIPYVYNKVIGIRNGITIHKIILP